MGKLRAKHIKKLRVRLQNRRWLEKEYIRILDKLERWSTFKQFECDSFFRGRHKAEYNLRRYYKGYYKDTAKLKYIKKN